MADMPECHAFIACSLDGYIARADGDTDWLTSIPVPKGEVGGYTAFIAGMDAILMGRGTYEKVLTFQPWPYALPVIVASRHQRPSASEKLSITATPLRVVLAEQAALGRRRIYVDGGQIISALLREGLLTQVTVTVAPVLLGGGLPLFQSTGGINLALQSVRHWDPGFVQMVYLPENAPFAPRTMTPV